MLPTIRTAEQIATLAAGIRQPARFAIVAGGSVQKCKTAGRIFVSFPTADAFRAWTFRSELFAKLAPFSDSSAFLTASTF